MLTQAARTVHVEECMGTVFTIDVRDDGDWAVAIAEAVAWLHHVDEVFSTYRPDSEIRRLGRGDLRLKDTGEEVREVLALCEQVRLDSDGAFMTAPFGVLDPSALVKGWAIDKASRLLGSHGSANHAVNGGGDMQLAGEAAPGRAWRVGIAHPLRKGEMATVVGGRDLAVATSGTAERGPHIFDPGTGRPAIELASVTVVGERLTMVDAYATAAFAMGHRASAWVEGLDGYEAMAVAANGGTWQSSGFAAYDASEVWPG